MEDYKKNFETVTILHDETDGLVTLEAITRHGQDRATKIKNNFIGHLCAADPKLLVQILEILNTKLPTPTQNEVVVGIPTSGIVMSSFFGLVRGVPYNFALNLGFGDTDAVFSFQESHRSDTVKYLYGVQPGDTVVIIEDEVTSGGGVIALAKALQTYGLTVTAIATVVETMNFCAREKIKTETSIDLISLVQIELS